ncbi:MAG: serine/threonine protein kinase [Deltaproteobacteria bacterium]|nr:serine/threonine protein kinase [Deltaproteobacteria bacterium]
MSSKRTKLGIGDHHPKRTSPPNELVGHVILDRYHVEEELGHGAMGVVYRGRHTKLARDVAIKVMHDHLVHERTLVERFRREAQVAGRLHHPNVVGVIDVGELPDKRQVMVMELARGESLASIMERPMPRSRLVKLVAQLLQGLDHAHAAGLVHRDLKPENVIVEDGDVARIVDFGIAVLREPEANSERLTDTGMIVGTPLYMAPEQAKDEAVDHRADLYALGVIMYEIIAGQPPFLGSPMDVALAKIREELPELPALPDGAKLLGPFMRKLAARDRDRRFASAHEALTTLQLIDSDPYAASVALGIMDVARALDTIKLS